MTTKPEIDSAPGISWRPLTRDRWQASWKCRADLAKKGFRPVRCFIWSGVTPDATAIQLIQDTCQRLHNEMLIWGRGGFMIEEKFSGTMASLIACYQTDADSPYHKIRYKSKHHYDYMCRRLEDDITEPLKDLNARSFLRLHEKWTAGGRVTWGHSLIGMVRILVNFGATFLEDAECERLSGVLHRMKFKQGKPRDVHITSDQVIAIRNMMHEKGKPSMALAQAFQFECMLRQKDVIGEWVPLSEPGPLSTVFAGNSKWIRGIKWEEIDANLVLRHETSKREKMLEVPLSKAQMVMEEFDRQFPHFKTMDRGALPATGPVIVSEYSRIPWVDDEYRRQWRHMANAAGLPKSIRSMDSRAGAITEATEAGAELEHVKHAATHGDISMTQRYSRGAADKIAGVMDKRAAHRNKTGKPD
jgi:hypothetical protein